MHLSWSCSSRRYMGVMDLSCQSGRWMDRQDSQPCSTSGVISVRIDASWRLCQLWRFTTAPVRSGSRASADAGRLQEASSP